MLKVNLQYFADGDFDLEAFQKEFESTYSENETPNAEENEDQNQDQEDQTSLDAQEEDLELDENQDEGEEKQPPAQKQAPAMNHKQNQAFQMLRQKAEQNEKYAQFIQKIAERSGMTPDEVVARYEQAMIQEEAKKQNVPVEVIQQMKQQEQQLQMLTQKAWRDSFNYEVQSFKDKHELPEEAINQAIEYMRDHNLMGIKFEDAFYLAHRDTIIQTAVNTALQKQLAEKKKIQEQSPINHNGGTAPTNNDDMDVEKVLDKFGISF